MVSARISWLSLSVAMATAACVAEEPSVKSGESATTEVMPTRIALSSVLTCTTVVSEESDPTFAQDGLTCNAAGALERGAQVDFVSVRIREADDGLQESIVQPASSASFGILRAFDYPFTLEVDYQLSFTRPDGVVEASGSYTGHMEWVVNSVDDLPTEVAVTPPLDVVEVELGLSDALATAVQAKDVRFVSLRTHAAEADAPLSYNVSFTARTAADLPAGGTALWVPIASEQALSVGATADLYHRGSGTASTEIVLSEGPNVIDIDGTVTSPNAATSP